MVSIQFWLAACVAVLLFAQGPAAGFPEHPQENVRSTPAATHATSANSNSIRKADPTNIYGDLAGIIKASQQVVIAHINGDECHLSSSGTDSITVYGATIVQRLKGVQTPQVISFTVPTGIVTLKSGARVMTSYEGFTPPAPGKRYLLCLRYAQGNETQLTPGLRLVGDGVQGAFELDDELVVSGYGLDQISKRYLHRPVSSFINEIIGLCGGRPQPDFDAQPAEAGCLPSGPCHLNSKLLRDLGFHLPSYLPTAGNQAGFEEQFAPTQVLTVSWDSLPGQQQTVNLESVKGLPISSSFVLMDRKRNVAAHMAFGGFQLDNVLGFVVIGINAASQIRSIANIGDPRSAGGEGGQYWINPRVTFKTYLPDDPDISSVLFLRPVNDAGGWRLQLLGRIDLPK
jgi:hypothetical protein